MDAEIQVSQYLVSAFYQVNATKALRAELEPLKQRPACTPALASGKAEGRSLL